MSWKEWDQGEVVEAGDFQTYIQNQVIQRYANASERTTTLGTAVEEGMLSYREDANVVEVYDGSSWVSVGEAGDITAVTAGTALTGGGTSGDVTLNVDETELFTGGTAGYTALSNGTAGLSYQPVSHNYIINGAFDIWQRGTSDSSVSSDSFLADRWRTNFNGSGTDCDVEQKDFTLGDVEAIGFGDAKFFHRITCQTAGSGITFFHLDTRLEDVRTLSGQQVTFSFWGKSSSLTGTVRVRATQNFGSGGSSPVVNDFVTGVNLTTTWQRYSYTDTLASMSGKTIGDGSNLRFVIQVDSPASGDVLDIWGVQLEAGSIATPFKRHAPSLQGELAACQRYYWRLYDSDVDAFGAITNMGYQNTGQVRGYVSFPVTMRIEPDGKISDVTNAFVLDVGPSGDTMNTFDLINATVHGGILRNSDDVSGTIGEFGVVRGNGPATTAFVAFEAEL